MSDNGWFGRRNVLKMAGVAGIGMSMAETPRAETKKGDPSQILVGVDEGKGDVQAVVEQHLSSVEKQISTSAEVIRTNETLSYATVRLSDADASTRQAAIEQFEEKADVRYAEKNGTHRALFTPSDTYFSDQYAPQMVNAPSAWDTTTGSSSVKIAVVDQGVMYDHPDLANNMDGSVTNHGYDFVTTDDDGNTVSRDGDPYPEELSDTDSDGLYEFHGTHVAGIAAGVTDNSEGVAGISDSSILSVRVLNADGWGYWSDIADGVQYAADQGADIINMSLGGSSGSSTLENAMAYAHSRGVLLVVAAGNDSRSNSSYPAKYDECLSVSALDSSGSLASFSNVGKEIELSAPGVDVLSAWTNNTDSTWNSDYYDKISGTSMATPVVAGVAALAKAQHGIGGEELRRHLKETAADIGLPAGEQGAGRVDANAAVSTGPQANYHAHLGEQWAGNPSENYGLRSNVWGSTQFAIQGVSHTSDARGVFGRATSGSGQTRGVLGRSDSSSNNAVGVMGIATANSGRTYGFQGRSDSAGGRGALGLATASTGQTIGMEGRTASESGTAVRGLAYADSGSTYGVKGQVQSPDGYGLYTPNDAKVDGDLTVGGTVQASTKNFVQAVTTPAGERKKVVYTSVEAARARTEVSGVAELDDGRAEIELPEHFGMVTSEAEDLIVQLTPYGGTEGLKVVDRSTDGVVVESLDGTDYKFAYTVRGTRAGYEDQEVVREAPGTASPDQPSVPDHTDL